MTKQITNLIDAGVAYEHIIGVIARLHRGIKVIITETEPWWRQKVTTTVMMVKSQESQEDATQILQFLCQEIGGKEIAIKLSQI